MRTRSLYCMIIVVALAVTTVPAFAGDLVGDIKFLTDKSVQNVTDPMMVRFTLTNTSANDVWVLRYETPLNGFERDLLLVERDGEPVAYLGRLVMRLGPSEGDWLRIPAGGSLSADFDLSASYDMREPGSYSVEYRAFQHVITSESKPPVAGADKGGQLYEVELPSAVTVGSDAAWMELEGKPIEVADAQWPPLEIGEPDGMMMQAKANSFIGCTTTRQSTLNTDKTNGRSRAYRAYAYFYNYGNTTFYRTWFGAYTSTRFNTVKGNMGRTYTAMGYNYTFDCTCSEGGGVIAYVYPNQYYKVWICPTYWSLGSADRAAAIVHETTHWNNVAATDDYTYGYTNCRNLATNYPDYAIYNADNYRYAAQYAP